MIPQDFFPRILRFDSVPSTNLKAKEMAKKGGKEGTVIIATEQTAGRGRGNHEWYSPKGGLYLSTLLKPKLAKRATDISILAGAAVAQTVKDSMPKSADVTVKWPNDVLVNYKKIGGVLCESLGEEYDDFCVVGIGLNVNIAQENLKQFENNPFKATSFVTENVGGTFDIERVSNTLLRKLFTLYRLYQETGFKSVQYIWERNCRFIGKKVEFQDIDWQNQEAKENAFGKTQGVFQGIDASGAAVIMNDKGERHTYYSGEITCFWQ
jgi:BirA family biotin operon repressor/biotin-[acetyl-CoA-carboxylase] ligase